MQSLKVCKPWGCALAGAPAVQVTRLTRECMEGVARLSVPLRVRLSWGPSWGELQEMSGL